MLYGYEHYGVPDTYMGGERPAKDVRLLKNRGRRPVHHDMLDKRATQSLSKCANPNRAHDVIPSYESGGYSSQHRHRPKTFAGHFEMTPGYAKSTKHDIEPSTDFKIEQFMKYSYFPEPSRFDRKAITHTPPPDYELDLAGVDIPPPDYDGHVSAEDQMEEIWMRSVDIFCNKVC
ncbi:hypothetical protein ACJMK2_042628 [Sinanodonta woodiana]|uniref:Uncharacterized protein n=1 Tax=Sinanodonta woodiana TaxID=1069815 RepID=A0ABD3W9E7_SINWO